VLRFCILVAAFLTSCGRINYGPQEVDGGGGGIGCETGARECTDEGLVECTAAGDMRLVESCPLACAGPPPQCMSTVVFVDGITGTDDPASCTSPESPCETIQYAVDTYVAAGEGAVINVRGEIVYQEQGGGSSALVLNDSVSGGPDRPTVLRGWPGTGMPAVEATGGRDWGIIMCCATNAASHVVLDGFEVFGAVGSGVQINGEAANYNVVRNSWIHDNGLGASRFPLLDSGITVINRADYARIENNLIEANVDDVDDGNAGIKIWTTPVGTEVIGNRIVGNQTDGIFVLGPDTRIIGNDIRDNGGIGIHLTSESSEAQVRDNRLCLNRQEGIVVAGGAFELAHNTVVTSGAHGLALENGGGSPVHNNIFAFNDGAGLADRSSDNSGEPVDAYNLYFANAGGARSGVDPDAPDTDIEGEDPLFVDLGECDLRLREESPARGAADDGSDLGARQD
jgi:hypothetical protein